MTKVLRLFAIRRHDMQAHIPDLYTSDQHVAKKMRDHWSAKTGDQYVVCPGPDHKRYKEESCESLISK